MPSPSRKQEWGGWDPAAVQERGGGGGGGGEFQGRHGRYHRPSLDHRPLHPRSPPRTSSGPFKLDVQIGNHLRDEHPDPIRSDQVIIVPSMFGSDLNWTTFDGLRENLQDLLRDKYRDKNWSLDRALHGNKVLSTRVVSVSAKSTTRAAPADGIETDDDGIEIDAGDGEMEAITLRRDDSTGAEILDKHVSSPSPPPPVVAASSSSSSVLWSGEMADASRRIFRYFSIDPSTAVASLRVHCGRPESRYKCAHTSRHRNCFVLASFGFPRKLAFRHGQDSTTMTFQLSLANNTVVAIMSGVSDQGWTYSVESVDDNESPDDETSTGGTDAETTTLTLLVSGKCLATRRADDAGHSAASSPGVRRRSSLGPDAGPRPLGASESSSTISIHDDGGPPSGRAARLTHARNFPPPNGGERRESTWGDTHSAVAGPDDPYRGRHHHPRDAFPANWSPNHVRPPPRESPYDVRPRRGGEGQGSVAGALLGRDPPRAPGRTLQGGNEGASASTATEVAAVVTPLKRRRMNGDGDGAACLPGEGWSSAAAPEKTDETNSWGSQVILLPAQRRH